MNTLIDLLIEALKQIAELGEENKRRVQQRLAELNLETEVRADKLTRPEA